MKFVCDVGLIRKEASNLLILGVSSPYQHCHACQRLSPAWRNVQKGERKAILKTVIDLKRLQTERERRKARKECQKH